MSEYYCFDCEMPCDTRECPNCFKEAHLVADNECKECGRPYGECICNGVFVCDYCGSDNIIYDEVRERSYCLECKRYIGE